MRRHGAVEAPAQVLILAERAASLRTDPMLPGTRTGVTVYAACNEEAPKGSFPWRVRQVRPDAARPNQALRVAAARARSRWTAHAAGVPAAWLWAVKRDRWLRRRLRQADLVVSLDGATDGVLALVPGLIDEHRIMPYAEHVTLLDGLAAQVELLDRLRELAAARQGQTAPCETHERADVDAIADRVVAGDLPGVFVPVDELAAIGRQLPGALGIREAADLTLNVLGQISDPSTPGAGPSGLLAQLATARLWMCPTEEMPSDEELASAAREALHGADQALGLGHDSRARARLADAMGVLFHRERHAEAMSTPLLPQPADLLGPLWENLTFQKLVTHVERAQLSQEIRDANQGILSPGGRPQAQVAQAEGRPDVVVIGGVYGEFHELVVAALAEVVDVQFHSPEEVSPFLLGRWAEPVALDALAVLGGWGPGHGEPDPDGTASMSQVLVSSLRSRLHGARVVFIDWADRSTVWVSRLLPEEVRLVVRIHSLDAFDPWFQLVDWSVVDEVIVVSDPLRLLVERMLTLAGAATPVTVLPNLVPLGDLDRPKEPGARTTLGMIGWGRRVKDPLWALDLLAREPSWRLILIGPDLVPALSEAGSAYNEQVRARLQDPDVAECVEIIGWSDDVAEPLRRVGVILSTSRRESWHLGLVEGAASGAVPVVRDWPELVPVGGARALFPDEWVVSDLDQAEARVRAVTEPSVWEATRRRAQEEARQRFDPQSAAQRYREVILGPFHPQS
ncbi:glycosyltransferase family protein [Ornithinimicrobium cryptoxanthini]|uniref:Glycosyltransferase n=1 Tax=Ornithinimicrobium cryptoxanthini TaxID=2934161 RepID=A0ABY4YLK4_9MICO|nr:glycosyltransferase [Ornithinimicrobium cryptoxanthini]USQ77507.1 glycosyltransferase [Ornithinimicrobium cryptoxanthini]